MDSGIFTFGDCYSVNMHLLHEHGNRAGRCEVGQCCILMLLVAEVLFIIEIIFSNLQRSGISLPTRDKLEGSTHLPEYKNSVLDVSTTETLLLLTFAGSRHLLFNKFGRSFNVLLRYSSFLASFDFSYILIAEGVSF